MDNLNEDTIKPTLNKPINAQSNNFEKKKSNNKYAISLYKI